MRLFFYFVIVFTDGTFETREHTTYAACQSQQYAFDHLAFIRWFHGGREQGAVSECYAIPRERNF